MATVDSLELQLQANATKANNALDDLVKGLTGIADSLSSINVHKMQNISTSIKNISDSAQGFKGNKSNEIKSLASALGKFNDVKTNSVYSVANAMDRLSDSMRSLSKVSFNADGVLNVANALNKLGGVKATTGTENLIKVKNDLLEFSRGLNDIESVNFNAEGLSGIISSISKLGGTKATEATKNLPKIKKDLIEFMQGLNGIESIKFDLTGLSNLTSSISKLGGKAAGTAVKTIPDLTNALRDMMSVLSKAPRVSQNLIDMTNALGNLARTGASSGRAANALSSSLNSYTKSTGKAKSGSKGLASALGKMYATYWLVFRGISKLGQAVNLSSDLTEAQNVINATFGNYTQKIEDLANSSVNTLGMSELSVKQIAGRFQAMGTAIGFSQGKMSDMSVELTKLAGDMASFYNVGHEDVARSLQAVFTGETEPLRKYGLDLTFATLQEWALKQGIDANVYSMSQMEKTLLRYQYVMANTNVAQGDFARTINTWANQVRLLQEQIKKFATVIGTGFIAAFKPFLQTLNIVMAKVISFTETVLNALGQIFGWKFEVSTGGSGLTDDIGDISSGTNDAAGSAGDLSDNLGSAVENAKKLKTITLGIDELNINAPDNDTGSSGSKPSGSGGSGGGAGSGLGSGGGLNTTMTRNDTILEAYKSSIKNLEQLGEYIGETLTKTLNSIPWDSVYEGARKFGKGLADFLNGLISPELFGAVGRTIANSLNAAIYAVLSFGETFDFYDFGVSIATGINEFFRNFDFRALAQTINVFVKGIWTTLRTSVLNLNWGGVFKGIFEFVDEIDLGTIFLLAVPNIGKISKALGVLEGKMKSLKKYAIAMMGAFVGNEDAVKILIKRFPKLGKAVDVVGDSFQRLMFGVHYGDLKGGINSAIKNITNSLGIMEKGAIGAVSVFAQFKLMKDAFYDIASGSENLIASLGKIAAGAGVAVGALKLIGLSNPWTAAITGVTALVSGLVGANQAMEEQKQILSEQEQISMYGDTVDNIVEGYKNASNNLKEWTSGALEYVETAGVAETLMAQDLSDRYFDLAEKTNLSNQEREEMKRLSQALIDQFPELGEGYDAETGKIDATRESLEKLIEQKLIEIQMAATEEMLVDAYKEQGAAVEKLAKNMEEVNEATSEMEKLEGRVRELQDKQKAITEYNELSKEIGKTKGNTEELVKKQEELRKQITDEDTGEIYLYAKLNEETKKAEEKLEEFRETHKGIFDSFGANEKDLESVNNTISTLTEKLTTGMEGAAGNASKGFANSLSNDGLMEDASYKAAQDNVKKFNEGQDAHSPSRKFEQSGKYSMEGYALGVEKNKKVAINAAANAAKSVIDSMNQGISKTVSITNDMPKFFETAWTAIKNIFSPSAPKFFQTTFAGAYNNVKLAFQTMNTWFNSKWSETKGVFKDVKTFFKSGFEGAYQAIKSAFSGIGTFFKGIANQIIDPIGDAINSVAKGLNWILKETGSKKKIDSWKVPKFASGTGGLQSDTVGIVNDQAGSTYKELIVPPHGKPFIPEGRNVMLPMERGTKIMPAGQTKQFMNGLPKFAKGVGDFFGSLWATSESYTGNVWDYMMNPNKIVQIAIDKFTDVSGWVGVTADLAKGAINTLFDSAVGYIKKIFDSSGGAGIEKAVQWALGIAADDSHGYDQRNRWGNPDYDCSALVISAFEKAGIKLKSNGATYTGDIYGAARKTGFQDITGSVNRSNGSGMKRGDILLSRGNHAALYIGDGKVVQASSNEKGGITGGKPGDQTGREIWTRSYYNFPWTDVLRYVKTFKTGIGKIGLSDLIPAYSVGGFPEDGLFFKNNDEFYGKIGGKPAVAPTPDISAGIEEAAYRGFSRANAENRRQEALLEELIQAVKDGKDIIVDGRSLVSAVDNRRSRNGFSFT